MVHLQVVEWKPGWEGNHVVGHPGAKQFLPLFLHQPHLDAYADAHPHADSHPHFHPHLHPDPDPHHHQYAY